MKKTTLLPFVAAALTMFSAAQSNAQVRPEQQLKQRQAAMTLQGKYFYPIRAQAQGKVAYDGAIVSRNVMFLEQLARMPWDGFTPATKDLKSQSTPAVFTEPAKFKDGQDRYIAEVIKLVDLTRNKGDEAAIKAQILAVDKTCNGCHDTFRERQ